MSEPFLGELKIIAFNYPPKGWAFCNGQLLPINQNQALFSILGTTYGGDGRQTFALPNLQSRVAMHFGNGFDLGEAGGETSHTLNTSELPAHSHTLNATSGRANTANPLGEYLARASTQMYGPSLDQPTTLNPNSLTSVGGSQPHENESPYLVLNVVIALAGIFPSQN